MKLEKIERDQLNALPVTAADPINEREHFYICPECDQAVDFRRLGDVLHHDEPGHPRLPIK